MVVRRGLARICDCSSPLCALGFVSGITRFRRPRKFPLEVGRVHGGYEGEINELSTGSSGVVMVVVLIFASEAMRELQKTKRDLMVETSW